jgi:hypothetical protein
LSSCAPGVWSNRHRAFVYRLSKKSLRKINPPFQIRAWDVAVGNLIKQGPSAHSGINKGVIGGGTRGDARTSALQELDPYEFNATAAGPPAEGATP